MKSTIAIAVMTAILAAGSLATQAAAHEDHHGKRMSQCRTVVKCYEHHHHKVCKKYRVCSEHHDHH